MPKVSLDVIAPDFQLKDFNGRLWRLSVLRGKFVLLIFNRGFT